MIMEKKFIEYGANIAKELKNELNLVYNENKVIFKNFTIKSIKEISKTLKSINIIDFSHNNDFGIITSNLLNYSRIDLNVVDIIRKNHNILYLNKKDAKMILTYNNRICIINENNLNDHSIHILENLLIEDINLFKKDINIILDLFNKYNNFVNEFKKYIKLRDVSDLNNCIELYKNLQKQDKPLKIIDFNVELNQMVIFYPDFGYIQYNVTDVDIFKDFLNIKGKLYNFEKNEISDKFYLEKNL